MGTANWHVDESLLDLKVLHFAAQTGFKDCNGIRTRQSEHRRIEPEKGPDLVLLFLWSGFKPSRQLAVEVIERGSWSRPSLGQGGLH
jgi:hypothetical protein